MAPVRIALAATIALVSNPAFSQPESGQDVRAIREIPVSAIPIPTRRPERIHHKTVSTPELLIKNDNGLLAEPLPATPDPMPIVDQQAIAECQNRLKETGASFKILPPVNDGDGCMVPAPLEVSSLGPEISLKPSAILNCPTALAAANWVSRILLPAAGQTFPAKKIRAVRQASGYVCRPRNNRPGAKLSEHATANAIDIAGFEFDDGSFHEIKVRQRTGSMDEAFQKAVRFGACLDFTTVLGPLSDANHADHLHFDLAQRRSGYRLCRFPEIVVEKPAAPSGEMQPD